MTSRRLAIVCAVAATMVLLLGGAAVTVRATADARWSEMEAWARAARAAHGRRDFRRPVGWGMTHAGSAFVHYRQAMELAQPLLADNDRLAQLWAQFMLQKTRAGSQPLTAQDAAAIREAWAPALAAMRHGAHCAEWGPAVDFDRSIVDTSLGASRWLVNLTVLDAQDVLAGRDGRRAVGLLLDALGFGTDLLRSPVLVDRMIGIAVVACVVLQGCAEENLQLLDREALALLAEGLERLDDDALATSSLADEAMMAAHCVLQHESDMVGAVVPMWQFGFSARWMMADAILYMARQAQSPVGVDQPWPIRERLLEQQEREARGWPDAMLEAQLAAEATGVDPPPRVHEQPAAHATAGERNPCLGAVWPPSTQVERGVRQVLAQLRCLRLAVDHHRGVALPALSDPLGDGTIAVQRTAREVRFVSVGTLGANQRTERAAVVR